MRTHGSLVLGGLGLGWMRHPVRNAPERSLHPIRDPLREHGRPLVNSLIGDADGVSGGCNRPAEQLDGLIFEHGLLNHSSRLRATIVFGPMVQRGIMCAMPDFKDRLARAMRVASVDAHQLANELDVTYTGIKKLLDGKSKEFSATNLSRAARYLGVNTDWLATGDGGIARDDAWPFSMVDRKRYDALSPEKRGYVQKAMNEALSECESSRQRVYNLSQHPARRATDKKTVTE